ncbi:hypothetical protein [Paracoccus hibiscisoli]|nr:hypothetical protein [Paracoccus hibiscisoli]
MIRTGWMFRAATAAGLVMLAQGCASSASRMPPGGGYYAAPAYAPVPQVAPAPQMAPVAYPAAAPMAYPSPVPVPAAMPVGMDMPAPATGISGLTERQPDLCKASTYASSVGQPGSSIPTLGLSRTYRVVEYRGIEPQDYDPNRIVFRLDAAGTITKIDCG